MTAEEKRLKEASDRATHWKRWGPYLSERAWGTVREDYSAYGTAWDYLPHDPKPTVGMKTVLPAFRTGINISALR